MHTQRLEGTLAILMLGLARPVAAQQPASPGLPPDAEAVGRCEFVSPDEGPAAEKKLARSPDDLDAHLTLLGCYFGDEGTRTKWVHHLFWLIDHHPESIAFECCGLPQLYLGDRERGWYPSPELSDEYIKHWDRAMAAHRRDAAVHFHAAWALSGIDPNLALLPARTAVELDPACERCRQLLGDMYGAAIVRMRGDYHCLPQAPDAAQRVAALRKEVESLTDPEVIVAAGRTMKGYSRRCGENGEEVAQFGMRLVRKGVAMDSSLIDRMFLRDILNASP